MEGITVIHDQAKPNINNHQQTTDSLRRGPPKLKPLNRPAWERHPNPIAHLKVLRDPRKLLNFTDKYLSPTQGKSDTYNRFLIHQIRKHETCDCEEIWGPSKFPSIADLERLHTHRFFKSLRQSARAFMESVRISNETHETKKKEDLMRACWEDADQRLEMVLKCENLDLEKWRSISEELKEATRKHVEVYSELLRAEEAQDAVLVQFDDETEFEPTGVATPFSNYTDIVNSSDSDSDTDSNDDYEDEEDEKDKDETTSGSKKLAEFLDYRNGSDDSDSDSDYNSDYNSDEEDDFSHFYNYNEEAESSTTVDTHEFSAPKPTSENSFRTAAPSSDPESIDQPERTWTLDRYESYLKRAVENYDQTRERYSLKEARENFLAIVQPRQQRQLEEHPCIITVIPNCKTKPWVPEPEQQPLPTIRVITPSGTHLKVEPQVSPLPEYFDEYIRERDAAQEDMQQDRELYFAGESSAVWEKRMEKFNRLEAMKKFHAFMSRHNITYPNFATMEKLESLKRPAITVIFSTIIENPEEEAAETVEYARYRLGIAQRRLDKAFDTEEKFMEVLIPATIKIRAEINEKIEAQLKEEWEMEGRWGYLKKPPKTQNVVDTRTSDSVKYLLINMLIDNKYQPDPKDNLRFISTTGETVTFVGQLREQQRWAYPLSLLPTAIDFAQQYKVLTPKMLGKKDAYRLLRFSIKEAGLRNMRKGGEEFWYQTVKDEAKDAGKIDDKESKRVRKMVLNAFEGMHESFPALPCEGWELPREEVRHLVRDLTCERINAVWEAMGKELEGKELEVVAKTEEDTDMVDIDLGDATTQVELVGSTKHKTELEERKENPKRVRKSRSFGSIDSTKHKTELEERNENPKRVRKSRSLGRLPDRRRNRKLETTVMVDSWDGKETKEESEEHKAWKRGTEVTKGACRTS